MAINDEIQGAIIYEAGGVAMANTIFMRDTDSSLSQIDTLNAALDVLNTLSQSLVAAMSDRYEITCLSARIIGDMSSPALIRFVTIQGGISADGHPTTQVTIIRYYGEEYQTTKRTYHWKIPGAAETVSAGGRLSAAAVTAYGPFINLVTDTAGIVEGGATWRIISPTEFIINDPPRDPIDHANVNPILKKFRGRQTRVCA